MRRLLGNFPHRLGSVIAHRMNLSASMITQILSLMVILQCQIVTAKTHHLGQCPLRVPEALSSTSPINLGRTNEKRPALVAIGHRGTSFNIPEHTIEGYRLALELGADYIEVDLVPTKDKKLVAMHDIDLHQSTDVASKFPDRRRDLTTTSDGVNSTVSGYFVQDFTLKEVKTLKVRQGFEDTRARSRLFDWKFSIPTFVEIIDLLQEWNGDIVPLIATGAGKTSGRPGLYAELKKPKKIFDDSGIVMEDLFIEELKSHPHSSHLFFGVPININDNNKNATHFGCERSNEYQVPPLVIQCFDSAVLENLRQTFLDDDGDNFNNAEPPLVYLVSETRCRGNDFWFDIGALKIAGIGPHKACLLEGGKGFMDSAKKHDLAVHPWTERLENAFVDTSIYYSAEDELRYMYCELGIHGIFAENVDMAVRVGMRGCDDFRNPSDIIKEEIKIQDETGDKDDKNKICPPSSSDSSSSVGFACLLLGMFIAGPLTFWLTARHYKNKITFMSTLHRSESNEII